MTKPSPCAIIVSHGQPSAPAPAEAILAGFAGNVAKALPDWHITSATLASPDALNLALQNSPPNPFVYPMFMSQGWFTQDHLRKRLGDRPAQILTPFGVDPDLPQMAADLLTDVLTRNGWTAQETQLFIAAHGSGRSPNSARDTNAFATALAGLITFQDQRVGFVEQPPHLAETAKGLGAKSICLPFFAARGGHVLDDIPEALDQTGFSGLRLDPIGCSPQAPALVAQALQSALEAQLHA